MDRLDEAINRISGGATVCFIGAGFSQEAFDSTGNPLPSTGILRQEIHKLIGEQEDEGETLSDLAEYCESEPGLAPKLRLHLLKRLTSTQPTTEQCQFLQAPWRSIFTTNFDDVAEKCPRDQKLQIVTPQTDSTKVSPSATPLYYLHGRAADLVESDIEPRLVLSETNYIELHLRNKNLHSALVNELHCATQVFFIGYSIRDIEVASRVFNFGDAIKSKSIVICHQNDGRIAQSRLKKFGQVYPIGLRGLVSRFPEGFFQGDDAAPIDILEYVDRREPIAELDIIDQRHIDTLMITGKFSYAAYAKQKRATDAAILYCVNRQKHLDKLFKHIDEGSNKFVVSADIGNGKSVFLDQITYQAHERGYEVLSVTNQLSETFSELETLLARDTLQLFLIDDLIRYRQVAEFVARRLPGLSVVVCTSRLPAEGEHEDRLSDMLQGDYRVIDLDTLDEEEISTWDRFLEQWGLWGERIEDSQEDRCKFLRIECSGENRSIIVSMFKNSRISNLIEEVVSFFTNRHPEHTRAFIAMLIASLCQHHVEWSRIVQWFGIDDERLRRDLQNSALYGFTSDGRKWYELTSTQLAHHIFTRFDFDQETVVDTYTRIVRETSYASSDPRGGFDAKENLKELMKYRFLTRVFGDTRDAVSNIRSVYRRLADAPRIRKNDQFWLQFAMSNMDVGNIVDAERQLETALGIASSKGANYSKHQLIDQRIRLFFLKNSRSDSGPNWTEIGIAIRDLSESLRNSNYESKIYPIRAATLIREFVEQKGDTLTVDVRKQLYEILDEMFRVCNETRLPKTRRGEQKKLEEDIKVARLVLAAE